MRASVLAAALSVAGLVLLTDTPAQACGCISPPAVTEGSFAVNQQAEQLIFEVEPGWVTAHVLIKYEGDPAKFAWIVPVPEVPELGISPASAFGLLDKATAPQVSVALDNICPVSQWACAYHDQPNCSGALEDNYGGAYALDAGTSSDGAGGPSGGVSVISEQVVGDYQTVIFRANEASLATQWLRDNGFVVNNSTSIYMESYVQQNMVFVAAKLVPGAGVKAIKPLKMRYRAAYPTVPLILTAVASQPNLTVTSFIYSNETFRPQGHPSVTIDTKRIAQDTKGRTNYPMVLARTIDEAGGDAFITEYRGWPVVPNLNQNSPCCDGTFGYDRCGIGHNGQCECPLSSFDQADCGQTGDLQDGIALIDSLTQKYARLTRITTRVSPEEMTFDPAFESDHNTSTGLYGGLYLQGRQASLAACSSAVIDKTAFIQLDAQQTCAATYCGPGGSCVVTTSGAACACNSGYVAQRFTDLDGAASVTCVPRTPPVDLRAGGDALPDACVGVSCGNGGTCIDRNGVAVCECAPGTAAGIGTSVPHCEPIVFTTSTPGAEDYSEPLRGLAVCAPPPPSCGAGGWLVKQTVTNPGVDCGNTTPDPALTHPGPAPTCSGFFGMGCGCQTLGGNPASGLVLVFVVGLLLLRRPARSRR